ncbi:MAG: pyridoxamine 5'-phosphate oxidase family protein [Alphaproteobacteria bacterium]
MMIESEEQLRELYGFPKGRAVEKEMPRLDRHCRRFIEHSPFLLLSTSDGSRLDVSPKGDAPGFVKVLDDETLLIPDRPGNKRLDGLRNVLRNPRVGIIFLVPNVGETLRVNGPATIHDEPELLALCAHQGRNPLTVLKVKTEEVFLHCAKSLMRSALWKPETWPERSAALPPMNEMLRDQTGSQDPVEPEVEMVRRYATELY